MVRWTSYNHHLQCYQGELTAKELYVKQFLQASVLPPDYDCSSLELLLDHLYGAVVRRAGSGLRSTAEADRLTPG